MRTFISARWRSIKFAINGMIYVFRTQPNTRIYAVLTFLVFLLAIFLQLPPLQWAILFITVGMVWTAEFVNTSIEKVIDLISPQSHPLAKIGKDVGAASVLLAVICSIFIGIFLLGPPLLEKLFPDLLK